MIRSNWGLCFKSFIESIFGKHNTSGRFIRKRPENSQGVNLHSDAKACHDIQMYKAHSLGRLKGSWSWLPAVFLASKWIYLIDPLLALLCNKL